MDEIKDYNNIILTGRGINKCLKEVKIVFKALGKSYSVWGEFIY